MRKYYVSCGHHQWLVTASTDLQACIKAFRLGQGPLTLGTIFRVSERGFGVHVEDTCYATCDILQIMLLAAQDDPNCLNFE